MALKAGYKGLKKSAIDSLMALVGAKVIKSISSGLSLSDQGALSVIKNNGLKFDSDGKLEVDLDTDTMEFKDGKVSAKAQGGTFAIEPLISTAITTTGETTLLDDISNYDIIEFIVKSTYGGEGRSVPYYVAASTLAASFPYSTQNGDPNLFFTAYGDEYCRVTAGQTDDKINVNQLNSISIVEINGISF